MNNLRESEVSTERRAFSKNMVTTLCGVAFLALGAESGVRRRRRRRVRRRVRRRIRRRITWRTVNNVRVVVVPVNFAVHDEFIMDDSSVATITRIGKKDITITVNKKEQNLPAIFEGTAEENDDE